MPADWKHSLGTSSHRCGGAAVTLSAAPLVLSLPQVVIVDEITNAHEVAAARTIANRGVVMVSHWLCWKSCQAANDMASVLPCPPSPRA